MSHRLSAQFSGNALLHAQVMRVITAFFAGSGDAAAAEEQSDHSAMSATALSGAAQQQRARSMDLYNKVSDHSNDSVMFWDPPISA